MSVETIALDKVEPNPYRNLERHPHRQDQLDLLRASLASTGFWEGLLVRPHPKHAGRYQLAFGHARWQVAQDADIKRADFIVHDLDDDQMIRAMADENVSQFGRDEYATYREAVTAAAERIMGEIIADQTNASKYFEASPTRQDAVATAAILKGDAPGEDTIYRYFKTTLTRGPIRTALKEYRESGGLAAWHAKHNPAAKASAVKPTIDSKALGKFGAVVHVQAFSQACQEIGVPPEQQAKLADQVLEVLKDPEPEAEVANRSARARKKNVDWQRRERPSDERLTARNIRRVVAETIGRQRQSPAERQKLQKQAHALSIESALSEMSVGLKRAAKAASQLVRVAEAIGGMRVDMTAIATLRLADCIAAYNEIGASMHAAAKAGPKTGLRRIA